MTREKIIVRDGKWCVVSEDGTRSFGCFDSEEKAKARLGQVEHFKRAKEAARGIKLTREEISRFCPPCAKKMAKRGWKRISAEAIYDIALASFTEQAEPFGAMPEQMLAGLCEKYGADPGFFTACEADPPSGIDDPKAFCAALHVACTGRTPAEEMEHEDKECSPVMAFAEQQTGEPQGRVWDVIVIREGESKNKLTWGERTMEEIAALINANREGVPVMSYRFETPIGPIRAHSPKDIEESGLSEGDFAHNLEGAVREAEVVRPSGQKAYVKAKLHLVREETRKELREAREAGMLEFYGLSVNAKTLAKAKESGKGFDIRFVVNLPSVDLVHFPSAGGKLLRAVASSLPNLSKWPKPEASIGVDNGSQDEPGENAMDWIKKVQEACKAASLTAEQIKTVTEAVKDLEDNEGALTAVIATAKAQKAADPDPDPKKTREAAREIDIEKIKADAAAGAKASAVEVVKAEMKAAREQAAKEATWEAKVAATIKERGLTEAEAVLARESCASIGTDESLKGQIDKILKIRESAGWPKGRMAAITNVTSGDERVDRVRKSIEAAFKGRPVKDKDGTMHYPIRGFKEAYRELTGVLNPSSSEVFEALAHMGRFLNAYRAEAKRRRHSVDAKTRAEIGARECASAARIMASSPTFAHLLEMGAREATINTAQFADAFANIMHNELQEMYQIPLNNQWRKVGGVEIVDDFLPHDLTRTGGYGAPATVAEGATYAAATSPTDEKSTATVSKKGDLESITLEAVSNDKIGAIDRIPKDFIAAMLSQYAAAFWDTYKNGNAAATTYDAVNWFHDATHGNMTEDVAANVALTISNLNVGRRRMRIQKQKDTTQVFLGGGNIPKFIIVPPKLEPDAIKFIQRFLAESSIFENENALHDGLEPIVVDFWDTGTIINSWFLQSDPMITGFPLRTLFFESDSPELFQEDLPTTGVPFTADTIRLKRRWAWAIRVDDHRMVYAFRSTT